MLPWSAQLAVPLVLSIHPADIPVVPPPLSPPLLQAFAIDDIVMVARNNILVRAKVLRTYHDNTGQVIAVVAQELGEWLCGVVALRSSSFATICAHHVTL